MKKPDFSLPPTNRVRKMLTTFDYTGAVWSAMPQVVFRPRGLIIWNAPPKAIVSAFVGTTVQLITSYPPIPAKWFGSFANFQQIAKMIEEDKEPAAWGDWDTVSPGMYIRIQIIADKASDMTNSYLGPDQGIELCMWGEGFNV